MNLQKQLLFFLIVKRGCCCFCIPDKISQADVGLKQKN